MNKQLPTNIIKFLSEWDEFETHDGRYYDMYHLLLDLEKCGHIVLRENGYTYDHVYDKDSTEIYEEIKLH